VDKLKTSEFQLIGRKGRIFSLNLKGFRFKFLVLFAVCFLILLLYSLNFIAQFATFKALNAISMNRILNAKNELAEMETEIQDLEHNIKMAFAEDYKIRKILGFKSIPEETKEMGTGGPHSIIDETRLFDDSDINSAITYEERLEKVLRQNRLQATSLKELQSHLETRLDSLEHIPSSWPATGHFLSGFGLRMHPVYNIERFHNGVDISNEEWTPIYAAANGIAKNHEYSSSYGFYATIDHRNNYLTIYAHLNSSTVSDGQFVKRGDLIGYMGQTGTTTGTHLHYEVRYKNKPVNPMPYLLPAGYSLD
jgi:murein DD-endopeptidase MepM/ murein hydrolase activator NlpD